tara:strand:+ start:168 stop:824 length:657 start_codon:yes stop_codon:yes gene_type:complete
MDYSDVIVKKPWGMEYLCYRNSNVAIWFLHIEEGKETSMHCHPNKNTGFVLLKGKTELSFLRNTIKLKALDKIHIFRSRFHSTKAISKGGAFILEVETPEDKHDLVRLEDKYGRTGEQYEGTKHHFEKTDECIWIEEANNKSKPVEVFNCQIRHIKPVKRSLMNGKEEDLYIITNGGICTHTNQIIVWPGDVIDGHTLSRLLKAFYLEPTTTMISITK